MKASDITVVTVFGAGVMGEGISLLFAQAGRLVRIVDNDEDKLNGCLLRIKQNVKQMKESGLVKESTPAVMKRITPFASRLLSEAVKKTDLVVETIPEILPLKMKLLARLDSLPNQTVIASNTGSIPITQLTEGMKSAARVIGTHFFNPAYLMPLVEVHRGEKTSDEVLARTVSVLREVGRTPVVLKKTLPGFIVLRITAAMMREIYHLLDEGVASPEEIDLAIKNSMSLKLACFGPMEMEDMAGLDVACQVHSRTFPTLNDDLMPTPLMMEKVKRGELGYKSGKGWLDYSKIPYRDVITERNRRLMDQLTLLKSRDLKG
jgi:3-hydroxybutyryl-CoA dehydrogenase